MYIYTHIHQILFSYLVVVQSLCHAQFFCNPMDCSPPGSSVHGISQARILEWVAIAFSRGSSQPRDQTCISYIAGGFFTAEPPGKLKSHFSVMIIIGLTNQKRKKRKGGKGKRLRNPFASVVCTPVAEMVDPGPLKAFGNQAGAAGSPLQSLQKLVPLLLPLCPSQELQDHRWPLLSSRTGRQYSWSPPW